MKNSTKIISIILFFSVFGGIFYVYFQNRSKPDIVVNETETAMRKEESKMEVKEGMQKNQENVIEDTMVDTKMADSHYIEYSKTAFEKASDTRRVLFFYASWCPTCKLADTSFKENENSIPEDVFLIRVNYNDSDVDSEEKDLAKKYGITYQHTFVQIDSQGNEITKWNGGKIDELLTNIK